MAGFRPRSKLWLESGGRLVMSDYRLRLLELVAETGSLASAAAAMGLSYRRAWGKVKEIEANLGFPLLTSEPGGPGGGHSTLTPGGEALLVAYRDFRRQSDLGIEDAFAATIGRLLGTGIPGGAR